MIATKARRGRLSGDLANALSRLASGGKSIFTVNDVAAALGVSGGVKMYQSGRFENAQDRGVQGCLLAARRPKEEPEKPEEEAWFNSGQRSAR